VKLDTQVKTYQDELSDLKKALSSEMEQLTLDFQELRTTLQKQQDDVAASLLNLDITYAQLQ
jgi:regulator of replication initiation timing